MPLQGLPVTPEEVCSRAMVLVGLEPLTSFNEQNRDEVIVAGTIYEVMVAAALSAYPWRFASGEQQLENDSEDPLDRYETAWHYPTLDEGRPLQIESVRREDTPIVYDIVKNRIYADADIDDVLIAHYQYRVEEAYWLPQFTLYIIFELASAFAQSITRNAQQISTFNKMAEVQLSRAKTRDSQSKTPKRMNQTGFLRNRRRFSGSGNRAG
jgi:hypothetical protein